MLVTGKGHTLAASAHHYASTTEVETTFSAEALRGHLNTDVQSVDLNSRPQS